MTDQRPIERILDRWFDDGPTQAPDRVFDTVADRIERQPQRPAWRLYGRLSDMNTGLKFAAAIAAVAIIAVAGYNLLPGSSVGAPPATPSPSPTATIAPSPTPTAAPSTGTVLPPWYTTSESPSGQGILTAGSHTTRSFMPGSTFSVPGGWVNSGDAAGYYELFPDAKTNEAEFARSGAIAHSILMLPQNDPYFTCDAWEDNQGTTAAEIVAAVVANDALAASEPVDVTIGGLTGKQIDVQLDPGWTESCPGDPPTLDLGDTRVRGILLDTPDRGVLVIFVGSLHSADFEAFLAEAMPIVESFQFELGQ